MAWSTIRKATDEDEQRLAAASTRFEQKHGIIPENLEVYSLTSSEYVGNARPGGRIYPEETRYLLRLWRRAVSRALRSPYAEGIAYGYVGYNVD